MFENKWILIDFNHLIPFNKNPDYSQEAPSKGGSGCLHVTVLIRPCGPINTEKNILLLLTPNVSWSYKLKILIEFKV